MVVCGALVGLGVGIGAWVIGSFTGAPALAAEARDRVDALSAITVSRTDLVLLRDQSGLYFVVDPTTMVVSPLRVSDVDLRDTPGKSLLRAP